MLFCEREILKMIVRAKQYIVTSACNLCGQCEVECPKGAITISQGGAKINQSLCIKCGKCYQNCPFYAIKEMN